MGVFERIAILLQSSFNTHADVGVASGSNHRSERGLTLISDARDTCVSRGVQGSLKMLSFAALQTQASQTGINRPPLGRLYPATLRQR
jgi:hypothetical protein